MTYTIKRFDAIEWAKRSEINSKAALIDSHPCDICWGTMAYKTLFGAVVCDSCVWTRTDDVRALEEAKNKPL